MKKKSNLNNDKAKENGLIFRTLKESILDTYEWWNSDAISQEQRDAVELDPKSLLVREKVIIEKWKRGERLIN